MFAARGIVIGRYGLWRSLLHLCSKHPITHPKHYTIKEEHRERHRVFHLDLLLSKSGGKNSN